MQRFLTRALQHNTVAYARHLQTGPVTPPNTCPQLSQQCGPRSSDDDTADMCIFNPPTQPAMCMLLTSSTGMCVNVTSVQSLPANYGAACVPAASTPACQAYDPWTALPSINPLAFGSAGTPSLQCSAAAMQCRLQRSVVTTYTGVVGQLSAPGDPCTVNAECADDSVCNTNATSRTRYTCALKSAAVCTTSGMCEAGQYCMYGTCVSTIAVGASCSWYGGPNPCAAGSFCYQTGSPLGIAFQGRCTLMNSATLGTQFLLFSDATAMLEPQQVGGMFCASGYGVPVVNATTGYPTAAGMCVQSPDLSRVGQPCGSCAQSESGTFPLGPGGAVMCAPMNASGSCIYVPVSPVSPSQWPALAELNQCAVRSNCTNAFDSSASPRIRTGTCLFYTCYSSVVAYLATAHQVSPAWSQAVPRCALRRLNRVIDSAITSGCFIPPAWAAVGVRCNGTPVPLPSFSVLPTAYPSSSALPSQSASQSSSPSTTPSRSITPTATISRSASASVPASRSPTSSTNPTASSTVSPTSSASRSALPVAAQQQAGGLSPGAAAGVSILVIVLVGAGVAGAVWYCLMRRKREGALQLRDDAVTAQRGGESADSNDVSQDEVTLELPDRSGRSAGAATQPKSGTVFRSV